mgnify:CR=1 FL=1
MRMINNLKAEPPVFYDNFRHMVAVTGAKYGDKLFAEYDEKGKHKSITYAEMAENTSAFGAALYATGLSGKRIALIGDTHPLYLMSYLALLSTNSVAIPIDKELSPEQVVSFLRYAEADGVIYTPSMNALFRDPDFDFLSVRIPILPDEADVASERLIPLSDMLETGRKALAAGDTRFQDTALDMEQCSVLLFTSGTTGTSHGVMLSHGNLIAALNASTHSMAYDDSATFVSVLPIHHTYEMMCGELGVMAIGGSMLINDSLKHVLKNFAAYKPTTLILVPLFLETMYKRIWTEARRNGMEKKLRRAMKLSTALLNAGIDRRKKLFGQVIAAFGGNLSSIVCGGAPVNPEIIKDFYQFGITVLEGYGITECAPLVSVNSPGKIRFRSVGTPVYGCTVKTDTEDGISTGEILVKGPNVMIGYYKDPEATAAAFTEDGFFRTGDIGHIDKDGYIYLTGRKKNIILLSNGKNIYPEEIEEYLDDVPLISESVVLGRQKGNAETAITAIIVPNMEDPALAGKTPSQVYDAIRAAVMAVNRRLPSFKHIADIEIRYEEFEKNTSRKIKRYLVK